MRSHIILSIRKNKETEMKSITAIGNNIFTHIEILESFGIVIKLIAKAQTMK